MIIKIKNLYKNVYNISIPQSSFKEIYDYLIKENFKILYINIKNSEVDIFFNKDSNKACPKKISNIKLSNLTFLELNCNKDYSKLFTYLFKKLNSKQLILLNTNNFDKIILIYK